MKFFDNLMSPLNKDHCLLFYYLGLLNIALVILGVISLVFELFKKNFKMGGAFMAMVMSILTNLLMYYFARIHYSICIAALN